MKILFHLVSYIKTFFLQDFKRETFIKENFEIIKTLL